MARSNRGGNNRGSRNNNPSGRNQYNGGVMDMARERPIAAAAVAAGAAAAGLFLWSKRTQISDQLSNLSQQISDWREGMGSDDDATGDDDTGGSFMARSSGKGSGKSQSEVAEEALTLKSTGRKAKRPADPTVEDQTKAGAVAY